MTICVKRIGLAVLLLIPTAIMSSSRMAPLYPADGIDLGGKESVRTSDARRPHRSHFSGRGLHRNSATGRLDFFLRVTSPLLWGCAVVLANGNTMEPSMWRTFRLLR